MATFHVYVEGAVDASPDGVRNLAQAISQRYGLPAADLLTRLTTGRFRVKANVDKVTAEAYLRALHEVGARVVLEEVDPSRQSNPSISPVNLRGSTTPPPRAQPSTAAPVSATAPPAHRVNTPALGAAVRSGASSLPPATVARPAQSPLQSGLSAAFTGGRAQSESGFDALGGGALSLSSVDGAEDEAPAPAAFVPPPPTAAALAPEPAKSTPRAKAPALDLFAPPDAEEAEALVELATDEIEHRAKKMSTPPAGVPVPANQSQPLVPSTRGSNPSIQPPSIPAESTAAEMPRARFAAGVLLSILLGFVPAHFVAASREDSASNQIDAQVTATQNSVEDEEGYRALDGFREAQLAKKRSEKRSIAWQSMLIWAVVGAGVAYVYFRRIPWDAPKTTA